MRTLVHDSYSEVERLSLNGRWSIWYAMLSVARRRSENRQRYADLVQGVLLMCVPHGTCVNDFLDWVIEEEANSGGGANTIVYGAHSMVNLPIVADLLACLFYGGGGGVSSQCHGFLNGLLNNNAAIAALVTISAELANLRHAASPNARKERKCIMEALQAMAAFVDQLGEALPLLPPHIRAIFQSLESRSRAAGGGLGPSLLVAVVNAGLQSMTAYMVAVLRDVLVKLAQNDGFINSEENLPYNNFVSLARPSWTYAWNAWVKGHPQVPKVTFWCLNRLRALKVRATPAFRAAEERICEFVQNALEDIKAEKGGLEVFFERIANTPAPSPALLLPASPSPSPSPTPTPTPSTAPQLSSQVQNVLATRLREFEIFLGDQFVEELLLFWNEANAIGPLEAKCRSLFHKYVAPGAPAQIPFSSGNVKDMEISLENGGDNDNDDEEGLSLSLFRLMGEVSVMLHDHAMDFLQQQQQQQQEEQVVVSSLRASPSRPSATSAIVTSSSTAVVSPSSSPRRRTFGSSLRGTLQQFRSNRPPRFDDDLNLHQKLGLISSHGRVRDEFLSFLGSERQLFFKKWEKLESFLRLSAKAQSRKLPQLREQFPEITSAAQISERQRSLEETSLAQSVESFLQQRDPK